MRKVISSLCLGVFLGFHAAPATAQSTGTGAIEGIGTVDCAAMLRAQTEDQAAYRALGAWLAGYLTALNVRNPDTFDLTPWQPVEAALAQVAQYCRGNSEARFVEGVEAYVQFLQPDRLTERSALIQARNGRDAVFVYEEVLTRVRARLAEIGQPVDGEGSGFDDALGQALLRYQRAEGISVTGLPDLATLAHLFQRPRD